MVVVAQLGRAPDCGSGGRRFETGLPPKLKGLVLARPYFCSDQILLTCIMKWIFILSVFMFISCNKGKNNPESCNGKSTRREVKLATDSLNNLISYSPIDIGVKEIGELEVPEVSKEDGRQEVERRVYRITAEVHKLSKHRDGDWKVKLTDGEDHYINCENPNPGCEYAKSSPNYDSFKNVRDWIDKNKDELVGKVVTITGIAFIDIDHKYPRNAAENELELHPILKIEY